MLAKLRARLLNNCIPVVKHGTRKYAVPTTVKSEVTEKVIYPPILDLSYRAKKRREKEIWATQVKQLQTVEEKLFKLNMPKYYGWSALYLEEGKVPYNSLEHTQYITRTHVSNEEQLPSFYENVISPEELNVLVLQIKNEIEDALVFEYFGRRRDLESKNNSLKKHEVEDIIANAVARQINRVLLTNLAPRYPHLLEVEVDFDPRIEAFWFAGGIEPSALLKKSRQGLEWKKEYVDDPIDQPIQYIGHPVLQLRHQLPLKEIVSMSASEEVSLDVPQYKMDPRTLGYRFKRRYGVTIPGFWPGDQSEFGLLSYHTRGHLHSRPENADDEIDALTTQAIFASYGWLLSQACYQGFSTYTDTTYPFTSQTIITNGQWWSFYVYQLNTTLQFAEYADTNPKRNLCWVTKQMKLFDAIENGKVHGLNDDVLKCLIQFYANAPERKEGVNMKPYLGETVKVIADIPNKEKRVWLEEQYKHLVCNKPHHLRIPEVYAWQKIYLIDHKTRPMDKKREPFEFGINPMLRRLDDRLPRYIPKCLRENPKKKKIGRFAKSYFP